MAVGISNVEQIVEQCRSAAAANRSLPARAGNVVELSSEHGDELMIVADLHGNRLNFNKLLRIADLDHHERRHLIMQEVCHGGPEYPGDGGCMSHLMLEDVIRLKNEYPQRFHFLLSNHELAELSDYPICKSRRMLNLLFRSGIGEMYGAEAETVRNGYMDFLASCPLAVRLASGVFVSHSLPEKCDREAFDTTVFSRELSAVDWKTGSGAFKLVWGRDFRAANANAFAALVGSDVLVHGHEPCSAGFSVPNSCQVILDSSSPQACYMILPIGQKLTHSEVVDRVRRLHGSADASPALARCNGKP